MFMFNKNGVQPRSRQSSVDSLVTDPSTSTSISDAWVSQSSDASSYGDMSSSDLRQRPLTGKRSSVFNLRSRSNTATSTTSSFVSLTPPGMGGHHDNRSSQDLRHMSSQNILDFPGAKRSLFRGKKGKRLSGSFAPNFSMDEGEEQDAGSKRASVLRKSRRIIHQSESAAHPLKNRISSPFDFQHITHTDRHQFAALEQASGNELVAEFWAVRASQAPRRNLNGIKADELHFNNFSSENLSNPESSSVPRSPPVSPGPAQDWQQPESPLQSSGRSLRLTRSVESFSQPGVNPRTHRHTQSVTAPPRVSSRVPLAPIDDLPEEATEYRRPRLSSLPRSNRNSGVWDRLAPQSPPIVSELPPMAEEPTVGHAVTTPDDSAIHPSTPPFSPGLDDVAEEPDRFVSPRPAPRPPVRASRSPSFDSFSFSSPRSPIVRSHSRKSSYMSPRCASQRGSMTRPMSQMSETLGSTTITRRASIRRPPASRRKSNTWRVIEESWEDDIDYIYDNALEADCDFDWDRASDDGAYEDRDRTPEQQDHLRPSSATSQGTQTASVVSDDEHIPRARFFPGAFRPSLLVPSASSVPELESRSAISASTAESGAHTPCDFFSSLEHHQSQFSEAYNLNPTLLAPPEFKDEVNHEEMYHDLLAEYESSDRHFPLLDATRSIASSTRSSHVRSSKRSSYDSSLMSCGQGSGSWSSPMRRSASSSGSLPELVHSRRARRDFSVMVDQLSEQVASFASFGEDDDECDDNDTTPPGRVSQDRTFFASEEDEQQQNDVIPSIEVEVRASLELARQGSTRSTRAPLHHKYASSDGVAKLMASPLPATPESPQGPKTRGRSASSSNAVRGNRQPYLSLFPSPPKHAQLPNSPGALSPGSPRF